MAYQQRHEEKRPGERGGINGWDNTLEDVAEDIKHDYMTNVEAKDGTILLHYLDECHELVVLPDRVLDDEDDIQEYEKYIR